MVGICIDIQAVPFDFGQDRRQVIANEIWRGILERSIFADSQRHAGASKRRCGVD